MNPAHTTESVFFKHRPRLLGLAYRMLGSLSDSEDVLQEAWLKWSDVNLEDIEAPAAYLGKIVVHQSMDMLRKQSRQREQYKGPWLPEPIPNKLLSGASPSNADHVEAAGTAAGDPMLDTELANDLSIALLHMLERLNPRERAVLVMKDMLGFSHNEIAELLELDSDNSRQLLSRARKKLRGDKNFDAPDLAEQKSLIEKLVAALQTHNFEDLQNLLAEDAVAYTDGGGIASAVPVPVHGRERILQVFTHLAQQQTGDPALQWLDINAGIGLLIEYPTQPASVLTLAVKDGLVTGVYLQRNPEKIGKIKQR